MKRLITSAILLLTLLALLPGQAGAHAKLERSEPAAGATIAVANAPTTLTLYLTEELRVCETNPGKESRPLTVLIREHTALLASNSTRLVIA